MWSSSTVHLLVKAGGVELVQHFVVIGMQADLMAFPLHALKEQLIALYILPDDKEGGVHPPLGQAVQKHRGGGGLWPVVKGEGYIGPRRDFRPAQRLPFPALLRLGAIGDSRQGQRRQRQRARPQALFPV